MKTATESLESDHVHIITLIGVMERIIGSDKPDTGHIENIVDIIRNFADGIHHAKEENIYFPLLTERGFSSSQGPVGVMLSEHVTGRSFVKGITENNARIKKGEIEALPELYRNMQGYATLLRNHIAKENNILFPMADRVLSAADQSGLASDFKSVENSYDVGSRPLDYIERIRHLADIYGVS